MPICSRKVINWCYKCICNCTQCKRLEVKHSKGYPLPTTTAWALFNILLTVLFEEYAYFITTLIRYSIGEVNITHFHVSHLL